MPRLEIPSGTLPFFFVFGVAAYIALIDPSSRNLFFNLVFTATGGSTAAMARSVFPQKPEDRAFFKPER